MAVRTLQFPLRGLASEGANEIIAKALVDLPGIAAIRASMVNNLLEIDCNDDAVTDKQVHDALARAGIVHGAHG